MGGETPQVPATIAAGRSSRVGRLKIKRSAASDARAGLPAVIDGRRVDLPPGAVALLVHSGLELEAVRLRAVRTTHPLRVRIGQLRAAVTALGTGPTPAPSYPDDIRARRALTALRRTETRRASSASAKLSEAAGLEVEVAEIEQTARAVGREIEARLQRHLGLYLETLARRHPRGREIAVLINQEAALSTPSWVAGGPLLPAPIPERPTEENESNNQRRNHA